MSGSASAPLLARSTGRVRARAALAIADIGERLTFPRDPLRIAMFVLTILNVSRIHQHYRVIGRFRPALLLVAASVAYAYLNPRLLTRENVLKLWPMRMIAVLGVLACLSTVFGISLGRSALFILDVYVKVLAFAFLVAVSIRNVRDLYMLVWAYVISCGILVYFSMFVFGLQQRGSYVARLNEMYTYDSNDLGVIMMVGLPLILLLLVVSRGWRRWALWLILLGSAATIARSGSRGAFVGFVAAAAGALFLVNSVPASRRVALLFAAVLALLIGAPPGYWKQMSTLLNAKEDYNYSSLDGRRALILRGIYYMEEYPVFGLGIDNFSRAECTISPKLESLRINGPMRCTPPHNSYVQAASELGVPGIVVWGSLMLGGIFGPLRLRRRLPREWMRGTETERFLYGATSFFPVAMIGFAVTSFFVSFAWVDSLYLQSALVAGLYIAVKVHMDSHPNAAGGHWPAYPGDRGAGWRVRRSARRLASIDANRASPS